jgi:nitroreductase
MIELLRTRRSIRKYERRSIDEGSLAILREALLRCPSSRGINPWTFIFVDDPALLVALSRAKEHGSAFVKDAALAIVICADGSKSDVWVEDCSVAATVAHLTAHSLGLGSCWVQVRQRRSQDGRAAEEHVREILNIPEGIMVEAIIAMGYPAETREAVPSERLDHGKIRINMYR